MTNTHVAIVGGGLGGLALLAGLTRAAVDQHKTSISITIFEPNEIGPGLAYDTKSPDSFALNHELHFMGSVNVALRQLDTEDFCHWVSTHKTILQTQYPDHDLDDPSAYVPRSLYGHYLRVRYEEVCRYAKQHDLQIHHIRQRVEHIAKVGSEFVVTTPDSSLEFGTVVLTTGNYFDPLEEDLTASGRYFWSFNHDAYMSNAIPDGSTMLILGTGLFAYDAALLALESGKYSKVTMASRRGWLRKVRSKTTPFERKHFTFDNLKRMAGDQSLGLDQAVSVLRQELAEWYGGSTDWDFLFTPEEIVTFLRQDVSRAAEGRISPWRSLLASIPDAERHAIFSLLGARDKERFFRDYTSLYNAFLAPAPLPQAKKLLAYIDSGQLSLVNATKSVVYLPERGKFKLHAGSQSASLYADVCIAAKGMGRSIAKDSLYRSLIATDLASPNPLGGIRVQVPTYEVLNKNGEPVGGLYAAGYMTCGETIVSYNSIHMTRIGLELGSSIVGRLPAPGGLFTLPAE